MFLAIISGTAAILLAFAMSIYPYDRWGEHNRMIVFWVLISLGIFLYAIAFIIRCKTRKTEITPLIAFKKFIANRISENLNIHLFVLTWREPKKHQIALKEMQDWRFLVGIALKIALGEETQKKIFCQIPYQSGINQLVFTQLRDPLLESPDTNRLIRLFEYYRNELTKMYNEITEVKDFKPIDLAEYERKLVLEPKKKRFIFW